MEDALKMPEGHCVVVGGQCLCPVESSHCPCVVMTQSQLGHGSGQHLEPGHHSSLVTNIKYAQGPAAAEREALQCSGSGHESQREKTHCEDLCGQA